MNTLKAQNEGEKLWKTLQKMKFGNACIKETVRLFPPLIFLMRAVVQKRVNAGRNKCTIPKGHTVMICNSVAMRLPEVFDNPDEYVPDRWMDDEKRMVRLVSILAPKVARIRGHSFNEHFFVVRPGLGSLLVRRLRRGYPFLHGRVFRVHANQNYLEVCAASALLVTYAPNLTLRVLSSFLVFSSTSTT